MALALGACSTSSGNKTAGGQAAVQGGYKIGVPYQIEGKWYYPKENFDYDRVGIASWYGNPFHGKAAASGERYDMWALTGHCSHSFDCSRWRTGWRAGQNSPSDGEPSPKSCPNHRCA